MKRMLDWGSAGSTILLAALLLAMLLVAGRGACAAELTFSGNRPEMGREQLQQAESLLLSGRQQEGVSLLRGLLIGSYPPELRYQAHLLLARYYLARGEQRSAQLHLERVPGAWPDPRNRLVRGAALVFSGRMEEGLELLGALDPQAFDPGDRQFWYHAQAEARLRQGSPLQALSFLGRGAAAAPPGSESWRSLLAAGHAILLTLGDAELAEVAFMWEGTALGQDARLQRALRLYRAGAQGAAGELAAAIIESPLRFPYRDEAVLLWERLSGQPWLQRSVGVLLPLSGRYLAFGELVKRGMELAREVHGDGQAPIPFLYRDSAADPEVSAELVRELAQEERVMAVAGPLTGAASLAAAVRAQQEQVPMLALSQREGLPEVGSFVFRDSLTTGLQVGALLDYAMEERGWGTFAILAPANRLGQEMADRFAAGVEARGGTVTARQSYPEDATDFGRAIKLLKGEDPDAPEVEQPPATEAPIEEEPLPFEVLFIPDYADRIGLLAPQLAYFGVEGAQLLGINGWNDAELLRTAGRYVEGAVFVDGFFRYSPYPFVQEFVNRFYQTYGEEPSILEAQGYDVAGILLTLLARPDIRTRQELRLALARLENYPGVTGATRFDLQGEAEKVLFLLQVQNGNIVQIN